MSFDPAIHHRRSIRLKGHDYAGGGVYFVTICAHREAMAACRGVPFGATCMSPRWATGGSPVRGIIAEEWRRCGEIRNDVVPGEFVVMPDHFHGLIRIQKGPSALGHVIGAFKAAVSRRIRRGDTHVAPNIRIWHRNYYERIVRSAEAERRIAEYIRMNPWRCVQDFGGGLRGIGNPALWNGEKLGVLCSRTTRATQVSPVRMPEADVYFGGWHSPMERALLQDLLAQGRRIIACPAWGIEGATPASPMLKALEENRMLILEMRDVSGNLAAAEARNRFVLEHADALFTPHVAPGGMLDRLLKTYRKAS